MSPRTFARVNQPDLLRQIKSDAGYARVAGVELTLLDCVRYFHKATGINSVAQIVKDIGVKAEPRVLASAAMFYENSSVRRLGYLLDRVRRRRALLGRQFSSRRLINGMGGLGGESTRCSSYLDSRNLRISISSQALHMPPTSSCSPSAN